MKQTVTWARRTLKAVEKLIGQYKDGTHEVKNCPLCETTAIKSEVRCLLCPWVIFKGHGCCGGININECNRAEIITSYRYAAHPIPLRLRRLYGWRKRLQNIINKEAN